MNDGNDKHEGAWWGNLETLKPSQVQSDYSYVDEDDRRKKFIIIVSKRRKYMNVDSQEHTKAGTEHERKLNHIERL